MRDHGRGGKRATKQFEKPRSRSPHAIANGTEEARLEVRETANERLLVCVNATVWRRSRSVHQRLWNFLTLVVLGYWGIHLELLCPGYSINFVIVDGRSDLISSRCEAFVVRQSSNRRQLSKQR